MTNRLARETSAYLRAAADHPVDWYPWGSEAFERARELARPIVVDIGASWCHYCHKMDEECYKNPEIARILNEKFISIRVDADRRPDVDARFQSAVLQITGLSGWPLTVFLASDGGVFYGGTYFPLRAEGSRPSFIQILTWASELYKSGPEKRIEEGRRLRESLAARSSARGAENTNISEILQKFAADLLDSADRRNGGFGDSPKFLYPNALDFLFIAGDVYKNTAARDFVKFTLSRMTGGGVYDLLGGGFHRYAVDERFEIPHFEKLLAQNAEMLMILARAAARFEDEGFLESARATAMYILETLQLPNGGFAASENSSAGAAEGDYYTFTREEIHGVAGPELARVADLLYQLDAVGNFSERAGHHTLVRRATASMIGRKLNISPVEAGGLMQQLEKKLRAARERRPKPSVDATIIPAWNALAANALLQYCDAFEIFTKTSGGADILKMREAAERAVDVILKNNNSAPAPGGVALLADFAAAAESCILLFEQSGDARRLRDAEKLLLQIVELFWNERAEAFNDRHSPMNEPAGAAWTVTPFEDSHHASGNALALRALSRFLNHCDVTNLQNYKKTLERTFVKALSPIEPLAAAGAAAALARSHFLNKRVVVAGSDPVARRALAQAARLFVNCAVVEAAADAVNLSPDLIPFAEQASLSTQSSTAFICIGGACLPPIHDAAELARLVSAEFNNSH